MDGKWPKRSAAALIKLAKKFNKLQPIGIDISAQQVDCQVQRMADEKYQNENNRTAYAAAQHAAHGVYDCSDNTGGQPQCQQAGVRKNIRPGPQ